MKRKTMDPHIKTAFFICRERYRVAEALLESEARYRTVARLSSEFAYSCIHAGANGFMISDRASEELVAAIQAVASGGIYLSPGIAGLTRESVRHETEKGK